MAEVRCCRAGFPTLLATLVFLACAPTAHSQATWTTQVVLPSMLTVSTPTTTLSFAPQTTAEPEALQALEPAPSGCPLASSYPPLAFPACYPMGGESGTLPLRIFSNIQGAWSLTLELNDIANVSGTTQIPFGSIWYRVDGGPWRRFASTGETLLVSAGPTVGYRELHVQFLLELDGGEPAGSYAGNAVLSVLRLP